MHVARHTDWGGKLNYPVNLVGGGGVTGGGEAEAADTGQAAGQLGEETGRFSWPAAGEGSSRPRAAMSVHSNKPLVRGSPAYRTRCQLLCGRLCPLADMNV